MPAALRRALALQLVLLALHALCALAQPKWQCRVCEDVAQTWHDKFPCAGNFVDWGKPDSPDIHGCKFPEFDCNKLNGKMKAACFSMIKQFEAEPLLQRSIWEGMMLTNDPYKTCSKMGKCEDNAALPTESPCSKLFKDPSCKHDWKCENFTKSCDETCYLCNWIVRDWPLFQEICKPEGAQLPQSVPLPSDKWPKTGQMFAGGGAGAFLEEASHRKRLERAMQLRRRQELLSGVRGPHTRRSDAAQMRFQRAYAQDQLTEELAEQALQSEQLRDALAARVAAEALQGLSSELTDSMTASERSRLEALKAASKPGEAAVTSLVTGFTRTEECFKIWNEIRTSAKARYFASWKTYVAMMPGPLDRLKGEMWDANVVCKCMGRCDLNRFEGLGLIDQCQYDELEKKEMNYVFRNSDDIAVSRQ